MKISAEFKKSLRRKPKGQQLIEVTLIIAPLIFLVGAAVDWGIGLFVSHVAQNAAREGARAAVTQTTYANAETKAKDTVSQVIPDAALFSAFRNSANVEFQCINDNGSDPPPPIMRVRVWGNHDFLFLRLLGFTTMPISRQARMYYERFSACPS